MLTPYFPAFLIAGDIYYNNNTSGVSKGRRYDVVLLMSTDLSLSNNDMECLE